MTRHPLLNVLLVESLVVPFALEAHPEDLESVSNQVLLYFVI